MFGDLLEVQFPNLVFYGNIINVNDKNFSHPPP